MMISSETSLQRINFKAMLLATGLAVALASPLPALAASDDADSGSTMDQSTGTSSGTGMSSNTQENTTGSGATGSEMKSSDQDSMSATGSETFIATLPRGEQQVDNLIGMEVRGADDTSLGTVNDLTVDHDGAVKSVVISSGGFMGLGDKLVAIPFKAVQMSGPEGPLTTSLTQEQIKNAPEFKPKATNQE